MRLNCEENRRAAYSVRAPRAWAIILAAASVLFVLGCKGDPAARASKYLQSGDHYFEQQKYREASIQYLNADQATPNSATIHFKLAQCYLKLQVWQEAYHELSRTLDLDPENLQARIDFGNLDLGGRQFQQAIEAADFVLKRDPQNVDAHLLRGNALAGLGNMPAAMQEIQTAVQLAPQLARVYWNLGVLQVSANQPAAAEQSFRKAIELDPKSVSNQLYLAIFYERQGRWADAEEQVRRSIEAAPDNVQASDALIQLYLAKGDQPRAEQAARDAKQALRDTPDGYRLLGDYYFRTGNVEKALSEYASLRAEHPRDLQVQKNYVQLLILSNRLDEADKLNEAVLKQDRRDTDGLICKAQVLYRRGHPSEAMPILESAIKADPNSAPAHYQLGVVLNLLGDLGRAQTEWLTAVRLWPNMVAAQEVLASLALRRSDASSLEQAGNNLIEAQPFSPSGYIYRGRARILRGDRAGGEADLKKAVEVAPKDPRGYVQFAEWRVAQKRPQEALILYEEALARNPDAAPALDGIVGILVNEKQLAKALARVDEQIARSPKNGIYYFLKAKVLIGLGNLDAASAALEKSFEFNPDDADALILSGFVEFARGQVTKSAAAYEKSIQQYPRDLRARMILGQLEEMQGNWQRAQQLYEKALQVQPDYPPAANRLAYILLEHGGNVDVALSLAQVARQGMPDSPAAADALGWAYYWKGIFGLSVDLLNEASKKAPDNPDYHYHLGLAYQKLPNQELARQHLSRVLQLNPKYPRAGEVRQALAQLAAS